MRYFVKRKHRVVRNRGPLVLATEFILKRMIAHGFPCDPVYYEYLSEVEQAEIVSYRNRYGFGFEFERYLRDCVSCLNADLGVDIYVIDAIHGYEVKLNGPHFVDDKGELRQGSYVQYRLKRDERLKKHEDRS